MLNKIAIMYIKKCSFIYAANNTLFESYILSRTKALWAGEEYLKY